MSTRSEPAISSTEVSLNTATSREETRPEPPEANDFSNSHR